MRRGATARVAALLLAAGLATSPACDADDGAALGPVRPAPAGAPWPTLAEWRLFADTARQQPNEGVVRFEVIAPLFTDYADKHRFIWLPEGARLDAAEVGPWSLPVGAIVVKTFAYPVDARDPSLGERLIETRLLVHEADAGWVAHTYVYAAGDPDPRRARLKPAGDIIPVSWIDATGATRSVDYVVPTANECTECHGALGSTDLLGVRTRQLDRDVTVDGEVVGQLDHLAAALGFTPPPPRDDGAVMVDPLGDGELTARARAWLDVNCAHCHSAGGEAGQKALLLDWESTDPAVASPIDWGACKVPTSSGGANCERIYDIVPGDPDASVLMCRIESDVGKVQMPPLGRRLVHAEGVAVIRAWIAGMEPTGCP